MGFTGTGRNGTGTVPVRPETGTSDAEVAVAGTTGERFLRIQSVSCAVREQQPRPQVHLLMSSLPRCWRLLRSSLCALGTQQTLSPHSIHVTLESSTEFISLLNNVLSVGADLHGWCLKNGQIRSKIVDATATVVTHVTDRRLGPMTRLIPLIDGYLPSDSIAIWWMKTAHTSGNLFVG